MFFFDKKKPPPFKKKKAKRKKKLTKQRRHRRTASALAQTRAAHRELLLPQTTPLTPLCNRQLAGVFAIEYVRNFNARRKQQYLQKATKEKNLLSVALDGEKNSQKQTYQDQKSQSRNDSDKQIQKTQASIVCEDVFARPDTSG